MYGVTGPPIGIIYLVTFRHIGAPMKIFLCMLLAFSLAVFKRTFGGSADSGAWPAPMNAWRQLWKAGIGWSRSSSWSPELNFQVN